MSTTDVFPSHSAGGLPPFRSVAPRARARIRALPRSRPRLIPVPDEFRGRSFRSQSVAAVRNQAIPLLVPPLLRFSYARLARGREPQRQISLFSAQLIPASDQILMRRSPVKLFRCWPARRSVFRCAAAPLPLQRTAVRPLASLLNASKCSGVVISGCRLKPPSIRSAARLPTIPFRCRDRGPHRVRRSAK